ncbi:Hypothetical predicted protein [Olea europaea subsp. europaea]|uniref:Myb/SANT-like domain-containing protein n=1 Tax=Olea europaea subsp. europaea TaxID=158383 RepID=A0A8S0SHL2_OLEEU|nr:Hypothetical predicted protein [Olea europaea subsp. europaea]
MKTPPLHDGADTTASLDDTALALDEVANINCCSVATIFEIFPGPTPNFGSHPHPNSSTSHGHHVDSKSGPRKHAQWIDYETQIFVAAYETVIADGHRNGKCFTTFRWQTLIHLFNTNFGHNWSKQRLKNRWDALRLKHKRFEELINSSGVAYDTSTGLISASAEW